jgi:hypothetical protein
MHLLLEAEMPAIEVDSVVDVVDDVADADGGHGVSFPCSSTYLDRR